MTSIELDMIQTAGIGALALIVGMFLTRKVSFLQKFCVPSPVSGGIIFSLITLVLYGWFDVVVSFDGTLKDVFMLAFFTSVGFQSDLKVLKQGGRLLIIMLTLLVVVIALQNLMPMGIACLMGVDPLIGMASGSISMTGGHGTAAGFASVLEGMGLSGAGTIGMAAATFGLIAGSMIGGPLAEGRDYDAAVLCAGLCGFGLGATPNAMANMSAVCYKYHYTVKPFLIVPIIGAMFADLINTGIISIFLNIL